MTEGKLKHTPEKYIKKIILNIFNEEPKKILSMPTGICNEVFLITLSLKKIIVRLNQNEKYLKASEKYIPLFSSKRIKVPKILASDYSKKEFPFAYQILSVIKGDDLGNVIEELDDNQLKMIAVKVASIFKKLETVPTNGKFGYTYGNTDESGLLNSWSDWIEIKIDESIKAGQKTGVLDDKTTDIIHQIFAKYKPDFNQVESKFYYDDISSKNVMIYQGAFNGLVDIDGGTFGDYREAIGGIKASWYGTHHGDLYTDAVMNEMDLSDKDREIVTAYALINRFHWLCEAGVQFNKNTSTEINWDEVRNNKEIINRLAKELSL